MGGLGPHAGFKLCLFGACADQAFGHVAYHVGSSLTSKRDWRDVDVRLILPDTEYAAIFDAGRLDPAMHNRAWTALGHEMTGLPIDFQIQSQTASDEFDGPRSALIVLDTQLPVVTTRPVSALTDPIRHGMMPGSHERAYGPECLCGQSWPCPHANLELP